MELMLERLLLIAVYAVGLTAALLIPRRKRKVGHAVFLFQGMLTWILGLAVVEAGWLEYPCRELAYASSTSFCFEFLLFPVLAAYYNIYYPENKSAWRQFGWLLLFLTAITGPEYLIESYTDLVHYTGWKWYWTSLSVGATLYASRLFKLWFFGKGDTVPSV